MNIIFDNKTKINDLENKNKKLNNEKKSLEIDFNAKISKYKLELSELNYQNNKKINKEIERLRTN